MMTASGKTNTRMPVALHEALQKKAAEQGVSLNTLIISLLAGGIGFKLAKKGRGR